MTNRQGFCLTIGSLLTLMAVTLFAQLPGSLVPSWLSGQRQAYSEIWPQGWAFFASQPDNAAVSAYRIQAAGTTTSAVVSQAAEGDLWGLALVSSADFVEAEYLANEIPRRAWSPCSAPVPGECISGLVPVRLGNLFEPAMVCGDILFTETMHSSPGRSMEVVEARIRCGG